MPNIAGKMFSYDKKGMAAAAKELMKQKKGKSSKAKGMGGGVKRAIDAAKSGGLMKSNPFGAKKKAKRTTDARAQAQAKRSARAAGARAKARATAARKKGKKGK